MLLHSMMHPSPTRTPNNRRKGSKRQRRILFTPHRILILVLLVQVIVVLDRRPSLPRDEGFTLEGKLPPTNVTGIPKVLKNKEPSEDSVAPLPPLQVFGQYVAWHSHEALSTSTDDRRYIIGYYSCPFQAGNRLHHFFNALIWAIVTNRTLLYKYYDQETCLKVGKGYDRNICHFANQEADCAQVLERASWIPSYDEWSHRLFDNSNRDPVRLSYYSTHLPPPNGTQGHSKFPYDKRKEHIPIDVSDDNLIDIGQLLGLEGELGRKPSWPYLLQSDVARERAQRLFSQGPKFLYGMIFRQVFSLQPSVLSNLTLDPAVDKSGLSIALHSRHSGSNDAGKNITQEIACLEQIWKARKKSTFETCIVYSMSDRTETLLALTEYLDAWNCSNVYAEQPNVILSFRAEHGPYSGLGFFRDLALASRARDAFIGSTRSSSQLLRELIEYDRTMELHLQGKGPATKIASCLL